MTAPTPYRRPGAGPALAVLTLAVGAAGALLLRDSAARWSSLPEGAALRPDRLLALIAASAAGLLLCWLALGTALAVLGGVLRSRRVAGAGVRLLPGVLRAVVAPVVGGVLAGSLVVASASGALADASPPPAGPPPSAGQPASPPGSNAVDPAYGWPDPGWTPEPPPPAPAVRPGPVALVSAAGRVRPVEDRVVVRRGDTLWAIAGRHLGPGASPAQIAREWPRWYAANRTLIGPDPDRIEPGQRLQPPTVGPRSTR